MSSIYTEKEKKFMKKKEKKYIAPNEASFKRWIGVLLVGTLISVILFLPLGFFFETHTGSFMGIGYEQLKTIANHVFSLVGMVIAIRLVGKTSLKDFVLGVGGKVNKKECLTILCLYAVGFTASFLLNIRNIHLRGVKAGEFALLVLFMLLFTWMQTTNEELIFRGLAIRWACKNDVRFTKKSLILAAVSSVAFALMHAPNPEVTSQSGIRIIIGLVNYAIPGLMMYLSDLYFGSLMPGILIHWFNNFTLFTLIASDVTVMPVGTLLVDTTPHKAELVLAGTLIANLPLTVYMILDARKKKAAAARET
jgi:membrane protease YdiL (CAAX protease family)